MKLFYAPGACSMATHIALQESGLGFVPIKVDLAGKTTGDGRDYGLINPKGYVPTLQFANGQHLTEVIAILSYVADQVPTSRLIAEAGTMERYRALEMLGYIATELHKSFSPLFSPDATDDTRQAALAHIGRRLQYVENELAEKTFLMGNAFTVADCYLFTVLGWTDMLKMDLTDKPNLQGYQRRIASRPAVQKVLEAEGLTQGV